MIVLVENYGNNSLIQSFSTILINLLYPVVRQKRNNKMNS